MPLISSAMSLRFFSSILEMPGSPVSGSTTQWSVAVSYTHLRAWQVAANALRMFAALSLRRSDDISLVFGDESSITRVPFNGGFAQFERTLDKALDRDWNHHRNIDALLEYARRIKDREALIVLATDEHAMEERHITTIRRITRTHPMVLIDVATMNPFKAVSSQMCIRDRYHTHDDYAYDHRGR